MKKYIVGVFFLFSIVAVSLGQDSTCVENGEHPGYRLMSQEVDNELFTREYILHVPANYKV